MRTNGYIRLHRRIASSNLWALKPEQVMIAITCLLNAEWRDVRRMGYDIKRGQWLTHYYEIAKLCPGTITPKQVRTALSRLSSKTVRFLGTREVRITGRRFLLLTIYNYSKYNDPAEKRAQGRAHGSAQERARTGHKGGTTIPKEVEENYNSRGHDPGVDKGTMILGLELDYGKAPGGRDWRTICGRFSAKKVGEMLKAAKEAHRRTNDKSVPELFIHLIDRERERAKNRSEQGG